jgi:hypothetical protein
VLREYVRHYNEQRPHRSLALAAPEAREQSSPQVNPRQVRRRDVLGGLIHEYHEVAACGIRISAPLRVQHTTTLTPTQRELYAAAGIAPPPRVTSLQAT